MLALPRYAQWTMTRSIFAACLLAVGVCAFPTVARSEQGPYKAHIAGRVVSVDYTNALLVVRSGGRNVTVAVTPSTDIDARGGYGTIADIRPGSYVEIDASVIDGRIVAQIIALR